MEIQFALRLPRFPVLLDTGNGLLGAETPVELVNEIAGLELSGESKKLAVIAADAEEFAYDPKTRIVMPTIVLRRRTKIQLIELFNLHRSATQPKYTTASLSSKRVERVVADLVALLAESHESSR